LLLTRPQRNHQIQGHHRKDKALLDGFVRLSPQHLKVAADHAHRHLDFQQRQTESQAQARAAAERGKGFVVLRVFSVRIIQPAF